MSEVIEHAHADATETLDSGEIGNAFQIVRQEELSAKAFLDLARREPSAIKHVKIVSPVIGDRRGGKFGRFVVEYSTPRLRKSKLR